MTAITLPNTGLAAGYLDGENGWGAAVNKDLRIIDALLGHIRVEAIVNAPPGGLASGKVWLVGTSPTGDFVGHANQLAIWMVGDDLTSAWHYVTPKNNWKAYVVADTTDVRFNGSLWVADAGSFSSFSQNIGDGTAAIFEVTHGLGTRNVHVTILRNAAPYDEVLVDIAHTDANKVTISGFTVAPSTDQYTVYVSK